MIIVILGAGDIGLHLASLLSRRGHSVFLVDKDPVRLVEASRYLDVAVREGFGSDCQLLAQLSHTPPDLLLAFTDDDEVNLTACVMAKQLGYACTVARIRQMHFLSANLLDWNRLFKVDHLIGPEYLVAHDFCQSLLHPGTLLIHHFACGSVQMQMVKIPELWKKSSVLLAHLDLPKSVVVALIRRSIEGKDHIIFPHGNDTLQCNDEVTFIGKTESMEQLATYFGIREKKVQTAILVGGSHIGIHLALLLQKHGVSVRLIDKDWQKCNYLAEKLPNCTIIHQSGTNLDYLLSEKVGHADAFVACTRHDEVNILSGNLAKSAGCGCVMVSLSETRQIPIAKGMGIDNALSPRMSCENRILSIINSKKLTAAVSFYEDAAEILEMKISQNSKIAKVPLYNLGLYLPKEFIFAMIQSGNQVIIPTGKDALQPGDTVIAITHPRHIPELEKLL